MPTSWPTSWPTSFPTGFHAMFGSASSRTKDLTSPTPFAHRTYTRTHAHTQTHTHTRIHTNTHAHTHTHTGEAAVVLLVARYKGLAKSNGRPSEPYRVATLHPAAGPTDDRAAAATAAAALASRHHQTRRPRRRRPRRCRHRSRRQPRHRHRRLRRRHHRHQRTRHHPQLRWCGCLDLQAPQSDPPRAGPAEPPAASSPRRRSLGKAFPRGASRGTASRQNPLCRAAQTCERKKKAEVDPNARPTQTPALSREGACVHRLAFSLCTTLSRTLFSLSLSLS